VKLNNSLKLQAKIHFWISKQINEIIKEAKKIQSFTSIFEENWLLLLRTFQENSMEFL